MTQTTDWRSAISYPHVEEINEDEYAACYPLMFHWTLVRGPKETAHIGYDDRWCYETELLALAALIEWRNRNFEGEPIGWHRHPRTGRRRPKGDATKEYVNY